MDSRWENVFAEVGPYFIEEVLVLKGEIIRFHIEVDYDGRHYWSTQLVVKEDLELSDVNLYGFILDEMVKMVDNEIEDWEKNGDLPRSSSS